MLLSDGRQSASAAASISAAGGAPRPHSYSHHSRSNSHPNPNATGSHSRSHSHSNTQNQNRQAGHAKHQRQPIENVFAMQNTQQQQQQQQQPPPPPSQPPLSATTTIPQTQAQTSQPTSTTTAPTRRSRQDYATARRKETTFGQYVLGQTLGEGEFGKVKLGWKRDSGAQVAIKLIRRETLGHNPSRLPKIYREINILKELHHPNIVTLHEIVETDRYIGIILAYASGGELFDYILKHRYLRDSSARRLFAQLISGVGYLHKKGIVHRDLKLENLLLDRSRNIIITDFGFANTFNPNDELGEDVEYALGNKELVRRLKLDRPGKGGFRRGDLMQTSCGSPCYAAPELVVSDSLYTARKVDVWSCGVIL
ncbi:hypothetical protein KEM55_008359, partial [Ascosphaera atra]